MSKETVEKRKRIMVFGTFDGLHKGHLDFFRQALRLTRDPFLIISIARDKNVAKIKGKSPLLSEKERMNLIKRRELADKVVLAGARNHIPHIARENPDIIALGYDQKAYVAGLKKSLKEKGILTKIIRLKPFKERRYKNHLLNKKRL